MPVCGKFCSGCILEQDGYRRVEHDGRGSSGIMIVGESVWTDELRQGKPFAGAAGSYLERLLRMLGKSRSEFTITNIVNCKIPYLGWLDKPDAVPAIEQCGSYLDELIMRTKPKVLVPLGNVALRKCCGVNGITERQGYVHETRWGIPAVPTFHPSFMMRGAHKYFGAAAYAFKRAEEIAKGGWSRAATSYLIDASIDSLDAYVHGSGGPEAPMVIDIETPISSKVDEETAEEDPSYTIVRVSISVAPMTAATFPWSEPYISWLRAMLPTRKQLVMWNASFDEPRLIANGAMIKGEVIDAMWCWHFLQSDLPKALGFVAPFFSDLPAWKHLSDSDLPLYSALDSDATYRCFVGIKQALERQGRWKAFETHCQATGAILKRMGPRGILIDKEKQEALKLKLEAEYAIELAKLQTLVPEAVKNVTCWKRGPKVIDESIIVEDKRCPECQGGDELVV